VDTQDRSAEERVTLNTFKPSEYEEARWPVVESQKVETSFAPIAFELVARSAHTVDSLFEVFDSAGPATQPMTVIVEHDLHGDGANITASEEVRGDNRTAEEFGAEALADMAGDGLESSFSDLIESEVQRRVSALRATEAEAHSIELSRIRAEAFDQGADSVRGEIVDFKSQLSSRFEELCDDMRTQLSDAQRDHERQAVDLALQLARKLVERVVEVDRSYIHEILAQALRAAGGAEIFSVRVSPQDYEYLTTRRISEGAPDRWPLQSDDSIRAGCVVTTSAGEVDFDLEKSWARISERVLKGPKL